MKKPEWKDAPEWANHLWSQGPEWFAWSASKDNLSKALWVTDLDTKDRRFHLWVKSWDYVEGRPQ